MQALLRAQNTWQTIVHNLDRNLFLDQILVTTRKSLRIMQNIVVRFHHHITILFCGFYSKTSFKNRHQRVNNLTVQIIVVLQLLTILYSVFARCSPFEQQLPQQDHAPDSSSPLLPFGSSPLEVVGVPGRDDVMTVLLTKALLRRGACSMSTNSRPCKVKDTE